MGFDNEIVRDDVLSNLRDDIYEATADAIVVTITDTSSLSFSRRLSANLQRSMMMLRGSSSRLLQQTFSFPTIGTYNNGVEHKVRESAQCTSDFVESSHCLVISSQVTLNALSSSSSSDLTKEQINNAIYDSMKVSMVDDTFRDTVNIFEVKEVKYYSNGSYVPLTPGNGDGDIGVAGGSIAGITIGSVLFLVLLALFVGRSRNRSDESVHSGDLDDDYVDNGDKASEVMVNSVTSSKSKNRSGLQFDPTSGGVIGSSARSYASSSYKSVNSSYKSATSGYSADNPDFMSKLDAAVNAGDWAAVADIANDLSQADEVSTMSSYHSRRSGDVFFDASDRKDLSVTDTKRAAKIDKLILEGDWSAVGKTAELFAEDSENEQQDNKKSAPEGLKRRTLLDFISGPWNSLAAGKAINGKYKNLLTCYFLCHKIISHFVLIRLYITQKRIQKSHSPILLKTLHHRPI